MRIATVREFRARVGQLLRGEEPVLVLRRGKPAGIFFPWKGGTLPVEFRRELFDRLSHEVAERLAQAGVREEELLEEFERDRQARRRR